MPPWPPCSSCTPERTAVCMLADKEEIGSEGVSGMKSRAFDTFMEDLCQSQSVPLRACYEKSFCLSADVTAAYDPNFAEVYEKRNSARVNYGMGLCKYRAISSSWRASRCGSAGAGRPGPAVGGGPQPGHQQRAGRLAPLRVQQRPEGAHHRVDLGGLGTLIASMASLISYKQLVEQDPELRGPI